MICLKFEEKKTVGNRSRKQTKDDFYDHIKYVKTIQMPCTLCSRSIPSCDD